MHQGLFETLLHTMTFMTKIRSKYSGIPLLVAALVQSNFTDLMNLSTPVLVNCIPELLTLQQEAEISTQTRIISRNIPRFGKVKR